MNEPLAQQTEEFDLFEGVDDIKPAESTQPTPTVTPKPASSENTPTTKSDDIFKGVDEIAPADMSKPVNKLDRYESMTYLEALSEGKRNFRGNWWRSVRDLGALVEPESWKTMGRLLKELASIPIVQGMTPLKTPILDAIVKMYADSYGGDAKIKRMLAERPVDALSDLSTFVPFVGVAGKAAKVSQLLSKAPRISKGLKIGARIAEGIADPGGAAGAVLGDIVQKGARSLPRYKMTEFTQVEKQSKFIDDLSQQYANNTSAKRVGDLLTKSFRKHSRAQTKHIKDVIKDLRKTHNIKLQGEFSITDAILEDIRERGKSSTVPNTVVDGFVRATEGLTTGPRSLDNMLYSFENLIEYVDSKPNIHKYVDVDEVYRAMKDDMVDTIQYDVASKIKDSISKTPAYTGLDIDVEISELPDIISVLTGVKTDPQEISDLLSSVGIRPRNDRIQGDVADIASEIVSAKYAKGFSESVDNLHTFRTSAIQAVFKRNSKTPEKIIPFLIKNQSVDAKELRELKLLSQMSAENKIIFQSAVLHALFEATPAKWTPDGLMKAIEKVGPDRLEILMEPESMRKLMSIAEESTKLTNFKDLAQRFNISSYVASGSLLGGGAAVAWSSGQWKWLLGSVIGAGIIQFLRKYPNRTNYILRNPVQWSGAARQVGRETVKTQSSRPKRSYRNLSPSEKLRYSREYKQ